MGSAGTQAWIRRLLRRDGDARNVFWDGAESAWQGFLVENITCVQTLDYCKPGAEILYPVKYELVLVFTGWDHDDKKTPIIKTAQDPTAIAR